MKQTQITQAISGALEKLGITGQLETRMDGGTSVTWIGKPNPKDKIITVTIEDAPRQ